MPYRITKDLPVSISVMAPDRDRALALTEDVWTHVWNAINEALNGMDLGPTDFLRKTISEGKVTSISSGFPYDDVEVELE